MSQSPTVPSSAPKPPPVDEPSQVTGAHRVLDDLKALYQATDRGFNQRLTVAGIWFTGFFTLLAAGSFFFQWLVYADRLADLKEKSEQLRSDIDAWNSKVALMDAKSKANDSDLAALKVLTDDVRGKLAEAKQVQDSVQRLLPQLDDARAEIAFAKREAQQAKEGVVLAERALRSSNEQVAALSRSLDELSARRDNIAEALTSHDSDIRSLTRHVMGAYGLSMAVQAKVFASMWMSTKERPMLVECVVSIVLSVAALSHSELAGSDRDCVMLLDQLSNLLADCGRQDLSAVDARLGSFAAIASKGPFVLPGLSKVGISDSIAATSEADPVMRVVDWCVTKGASKDVKRAALLAEDQIKAARARK